MTIGAIIAILFVLFIIILFSYLFLRVIHLTLSKQPDGSTTAERNTYFLGFFLIQKKTFNNITSAYSDSSKNSESKTSYRLKLVDKDGEAFYAMKIGRDSSYEREANQINTFITDSTQHVFSKRYLNIVGWILMGSVDLALVVLSIKLLFSN